MTIYIPSRVAPPRALLQDGGVTVTPRTAPNGGYSMEAWDENTVINIFSGPIPAFQVHFTGPDVRRVSICGDCGVPGHGINWNCYRDSGINTSCPSSSLTGFIVADSFADIVENTGRIRDHQWFYLSDTEDWQGDTPIHIGDIETVRNLAEQNYEHDSAGLWLYEVALSPSATIAATVGPDMGSGGPKSIDSLSHDVIPYLNVYEDPGAISILSNPHVLSVRSATFHEGDMLRRFARG